jgi:hypothetical protein
MAQILETTSTAQEPIIEESKYHFAREIIFELRACKAISDKVYLHWIDKLIKDEKEFNENLNKKP